MVIGAARINAQWRRDGETRAPGRSMGSHQGVVAWQGERSRADGNGYPKICGCGALDRTDRGTLARAPGQRRCMEQRVPAVQPVVERGGLGARVPGSVRRSRL